MQDYKINKISKKEFNKLSENDVMFITNPGRMGDENGSTFVVKKGNEFTFYRVDGWIYPNINEKEEYIISLEDTKKQFPKWFESWKTGNNEKYIHLYMGFGNGLSIDKIIYDEYEPYLNKAVNEYLKKHENKEELKYAAIYNVWQKSLIEMIEDKNLTLKK